MEGLQCARRHPAADDEGIALLVALAVVAILSVVILDFSFSVRVDMHIAANFRDRLVALEAAKGGVNYAMYLLRQDDPGMDNLQDEWAQTTGIVLDRTDPAEVAEETRLEEDDIGFYKHEEFVTAREQGTLPTASIFICDEERKINVNSITSMVSAGTNPPVALPIYREWVETLIENLGLPQVDPYELADNIADWIDTDDDGDAEYTYYETLPQPYSCRNGRMESIYELKLVKGMTDLIFFGTAPYPMQLSGLEEDQWEERGKLGYTMPEYAPWEIQQDPGAIYGLVNFLTAHSTGRINLLTAPREVLLAILNNDDFLADTIIDARQENPQQPRQIEGMIAQVSPALSQILRSAGAITYQSTNFRIESTGKFHRSAVKVIAIVSRDNARNLTVLYWRVEGAKAEESSQDVAWTNAK
jgi:type II secretory pathway component PulK